MVAASHPVDVIASGERMRLSMKSRKGTCDARATTSPSREKPRLEYDHLVPGGLSSGSPDRALVNSASLGFLRSSKGMSRGRPETWFSSCRIVMGGASRVG